jgi:hypothetical protein
VCESHSESIAIAIAIAITITSNPPPYPPPCDKFATGVTFGSRGGYGEVCVACIAQHAPRLCAFRVGRIFRVKRNHENPILDFGNFRCVRRRVRAGLIAIVIVRNAPREYQVAACVTHTLSRDLFVCRTQSFCLRGCVSAPLAHNGSGSDLRLFRVPPLLSSPLGCFSSLSRFLRNPSAIALAFCQAVRAKRFVCPIDHKRPSAR